MTAFIFIYIFVGQWIYYFYFFILYFAALSCAFFSICKSIVNTHMFVRVSISLLNYSSTCGDGDSFCLNYLSIFFPSFLFLHLSFCCCCVLYAIATFFLSKNLIQLWTFFSSLLCCRKIYTKQFYRHHLKKR